MRSYLRYIIVSMFAFIFNACTYDYEMPDFSKAAPMYLVGEVSDELRQILIEDAKEYGLTFKYGAERWKTIVREKDSNGTILYEGEARGKADREAVKLEVSYICTCLLQNANWTYYEICQIDFQKEFKLEISPYICDANLSSSDSYVVKASPKRPYTYNIDRSKLPVIEKIESLGYKIADVKMFITEKDKSGKELKCFEHRTIDGMLYTEEAYSIDIEIKLYGFENLTEKVQVGSYIFKNIKLNDINGTTLELTESLEHEFVSLK